MHKSSVDITDYHVRMNILQNEKISISEVHSIILEETDQFIYGKGREVLLQMDAMLEVHR